jgi:hypothetical protein
MNTAATSPTPLSASPRESLVGLEFRIRHPDGRAEQLVVDAERALIGSAAHCEVRLPPDIAAREHVEVFMTGGEVRLSPRATERPPTLDGAPCGPGLWRRGSVLVIGGTALSVEPVELGARAKGRSPFLLFIPAIVIALVVTILAVPFRPRQLAPIPAPPALFDPPLTACPMTNGELLPAFASEKLRIAAAKREHGPFAPNDAVDAVPLFETAAACFHRAGAHDDAREAELAASALRKRLEEEYHVRQVRLAHAFNIADAASAKREVQILIPMLARRSGPYVEWLASVDRNATLELDSQDRRRIL